MDRGDSIQSRLVSIGSSEGMREERPRALDREEAIYLHCFGLKYTFTLSRAHSILPVTTVARRSYAKEAAKLSSRLDDDGGARPCIYTCTMT